MATYQQATGNSIQESFSKFHEAHPEIFLLIVKECDRAIRHGKKKFSVKAIGNYIRWNVFIESEQETLFTKRGDKIQFKLNDAFFSRYARLLIISYPHMKDFIELRDLRS